ncbi:hypothetical protein [Streptomyces sp. NPDC059819]|uniref:hypothetical protein n=1 Tax=Streptomyces sp. NPDC059819 TaxID=3346963 RepID=UPI0036476FEB
MRQERRAGGTDIGPLAGGLADAVVVGGEQPVVLGRIAFSALPMVARTVSWHAGHMAARRLGGCEAAVTKSALPIGAYGIGVSVISPLFETSRPMARTLSA